MTENIVEKSLRLGPASQRLGPASQRLGPASQRPAPLLQRLDMNNFPWLKSGSHGWEMRKAWATDHPLSREEGGALEAPTDALFANHRTAFENGGTLCTLGVLATLDNELSQRNFQYPPEQIEKLGRKLFTDGDPDTMSPGDLLTDSYYEKHWFSFPPSWNDKYAIPVLVIDPSGIPKKKYVLALDEIILAFWKMVDKVCMLKGLAQKHGNAGSAAVVSKAEQALADARRLQRNVPFYWHYSTNDKLHGLCASLREDVETLWEYCGIVGWNRIAFIGQRRDDLQKRNQAHTPLAVAESLATIKWGRGRAVTENIVEKSLRLYTRLKDTPSAVAWIMKAQALWGRGSPWEEWTKLASTIQPCKSHSQTVWVLQTVFYEKLNKVRAGDYSRDELTRKANIISVFLLRHKFINGVLDELVVPVADHLVAEGGAPHRAASEFIREFRTVDQFRVSAGVAAQDSTFQPAMLPRWLSVDLRKLLRSCHEGRYDPVFLLVLNHPPKGGWMAMSFSSLAEQEGLKGEVSSLKKEFLKWKNGSSPVAVGQVGAGAEPVGSHNDDMEAPPEANTAAAEISSIYKDVEAAARDLRQATVSFVAQPPTSAATLQTIESSAVWKTVAGGPASGRVCFFYSINMAWDRKRPPPGRVDNRSRRYCTLWKDDFQQCAAAASALITQENQHYMCVAIGRCKRGTAGLTAQAGVTVENAVIEIFRKIEATDTGDAGAPKRGRLQLKKVTAVFQTGGVKQTAKKVVGVCGATVESIYFIYRGTWPSKLKCATRDHFGGTTWDDQWCGIPTRESSDSTCSLRVPYSVKEAVFGNVWLATAQAEEEAAEGESAEVQPNVVEAQPDTSRSPNSKRKHPDQTDKKEGGHNKDKHNKKGNGKQENDK